ncbi:MAG: putative quinol monooxygenase [Parabacteroides sp.]|nr:putative quinol monooxygenase [Parabacteroides sp.]
MKKLGMLLMAIAMVGFASCGSKSANGDKSSACGDSCACGKSCKDSTQVAKPAKKTIVCRVLVKEGKQADFIKVAKTLTDSTRVEPGNVSYNLYQSPFDSKLFVFYEEYKDDAAFQAHAGSAHFKAFSDAIKNLIDGNLQIDQY